MTLSVTRTDALAALSSDHLGKLAVLPVELAWNPRIQITPVNGILGASSKPGKATLETGDLRLRESGPNLE